MLLSIASAVCLGGSLGCWTMHVARIRKLLKETHFPITTVRVFDVVEQWLPSTYPVIFPVGNICSSPKIHDGRMTIDYIPKGYMSYIQDFAMDGECKVPEISPNSIPVKTNLASKMQTFRPYNLFNSGPNEKKIQSFINTNANSNRVLLEFYCTNSTDKVYHVDAKDIEYKSGFSFHINPNLSMHSNYPMMLAMKFVSFGHGIYGSAIMLSWCAFMDFQI